MAYSVIDISNKIIANTEAEQGELISNLKLQKLLYYLNGFFMAAFDKKLFGNPIEAWQYGPVVREAYFHFKDFGSGAISTPEKVEIITMSKEDEALFSEVMEEYGQFSAIKLMNMTHEELPWQKTFNENPQGEIPDALILEYFKTQIIE
ncbi:Panacea domain-containing protein [Flavobacterium hauense]